MHRFHRFLLAPLVLVLALFVGACGDDDDDNPVIPPTTLELNSGTLGNGATYVHTFATAGTYGYHCNFHSGMNGTIIVDPASTVGVLGISITDNAFTPSSTTVDTGAVVTWTNNGASSHTVTSN